MLENRQDVVFSQAKQGGDHGTRVASIAGAPVNGQGISGVFPTVGLGAWDGGDDGVTTTQELNAIRRAVSKRYSVINMSFGSNIDASRFRDPAQRAEALGIARGYGAGIMFVAAAGNEFEDTDNPNPYEAPAGTPHVFTAAASTTSDTRSSFSNVQPYNDVAAPGEELVLARPQPFGQAGGGCEPTFQWCETQGTSFSSPLVAGAAALVWSARPSLNVGQVEGVLRSSARDVGAVGYDNEFGYGNLRPLRARRARAGRRPDGAERGHGAGRRHGLRAPGPVPPRPAPAQGGEVHRRDDRRDRGPGRPLPRRRPGRQPPDVHTAPAGRRRRPDDLWNANVSGTGFYDRPDEAPLGQRRKRGLQVETITLRGPTRGLGFGFIQVTAGKNRAVGGAYELTVRRT